MTTTVVVGNPKVASGTRQAAELVVERLTGRAPDAVIEVAELGAGLLGWGDRAVAAAKQTVLAADLVVVASPTYKATYTGLLKLFLDQFAAGQLGGVIAIPLMLGAGPRHALAAEVHLKPVLSELGAICPTPALYLLESEWATSPELEAWVGGARRTLSGVL